MMLLVGLVFLAGIVIRIWYMAEWRPAFLGYGDSSAYLVAAAFGLDYDGSRPGGYPLFMRFGHTLDDHLSFAVALQHLLGVLTAALLYLAVARATGIRWLGLIPAAWVLFDGMQLTLEHSLMTESLFTCLLAGTLLCAVRSFEGGWAWPVATGGLAAASGLVKSTGMLVLAFLLLCLVAWGDGWRARARVAGLTAAGGAGVVLLLFIYVGVAGRARDSAKVSPAGGRALYSRVASFADCGQFDVPDGTRVLCEPRSAAREAKPTNYYLHDPRNPAYRAFGPAGGEDRRVRSFAIATILAQPLDYLSAVGDDLGRFARPQIPGGRTGDLGVYVELARNPAYERLTIARGSGYYADVSRLGGNSDALMGYATTVLVDGWLMLLLLIAPVASLLVTRGDERRFVVLFAGAGWLLILAAAATTDYDPRYAAVALPVLVAATAPAIGRGAANLSTPRGLGRSSRPYACRMRTSFSKR